MALFPGFNKNAADDFSVSVCICVCAGVCVCVISVYQFNFFLLHSLSVLQSLLEKRKLLESKTGILDSAGLFRMCTVEPF